MSIDLDARYEKIPVVRWLVLQRVCSSRKEATNVIRQSQVKVNGDVCSSNGHLVGKSDTVECNGEIIVWRMIEHIHYIMHKPNGSISSRANVRQLKGGGIAVDNRKSIYEFLPECKRDHMNSIGRLDFDTTGLLLFTSDGKLHNTLASPDYKVEKIYRCTLRSPELLSEEAIGLLDEGVRLPHAKGAIVRGTAWNVEGSPGVVDLTIIGGFKHQVKHMMAIVKRPLRLLHRLSFAGLTLPEDLTEGQCRPLNQTELGHLYCLAKERLDVQFALNVNTPKKED